MIKYDFICDLPLHPYSTTIVWQLKIHFCLCLLGWRRIERRKKKFARLCFSSERNRNETNGINHIFQYKTKPNQIMSKANVKCSTSNGVSLLSTYSLSVHVRLCMLACMFACVLVRFCCPRPMPLLLLYIFCTQRTSGWINIIHLFIFTFSMRPEKSAEHSEIMRHNTESAQRAHITCIFSKQMSFLPARAYPRSIFHIVFGDDECDA